MIKYIAALKVLETQLDILSDDFKYIKDYNPIEHIKTRIKSADSIIDKLERKNLDFTIDNIENNIFDIVGARINETYKVKAEIQIRTMAMDLWASLEHKIKYKSKKIINDYVNITFKQSSELLYELDNTMDNILNEGS